MQFAQRGVWGGWKPHRYWVFPHYMWGYITAPKSKRRKKGVPSLYVRVYRHHQDRGENESRSLIICEGISGMGMQEIRVSSFPHYMWGYIVGCRFSPGFRYVPSLYVRVYRARVDFMRVSGCSLIICEGISPNCVKWSRLAWFPHYMWGYIDAKRHAFQKFSVPSLYVRVYRRESKNIRNSMSSLIICEGISLDS